ncbi:hypothetical protein CHS0354_026058 [Potamilus streckersoni]|nr:hypothetical protein CHS0354_026058 [Potamilus streckersoni]
MIKPVQRFPQFILILKDVLKYTLDDEIEKRQLQDSLALLEHFGHQLNERKRMSEQMLEAQRIYSKSTKLKFRPNAERGNHWLIRQDDVRQLYDETNGNQETKERRLLLMNACLLSAYMPLREGKDYTLKWSVDLQHLDLKGQSMTPGLVKSKHEDTTTHLAELNILKSDSSTLEQMIDLAKTLYRSYPGVLGTLQMNLESLHQKIQKTFNTTGIELIDLTRNKTYSFLFENNKTKQEWCTDFLIAKYNSDSSNNPAWSIQEGASADSVISPACFIQPLSADVPRQFTKVICATLVIIPVSDTPSIGLPCLWVCSAAADLGKVSIISFHSGHTYLMESFKACSSEITCAEMIPAYDHVQHELAYSMDTVWMGTADSEIIVLSVSNPQNVTRAPLQAFNTTEVVITLKYINNRVFAGCRTGNLLIFSRHEDGVWTESNTFAVGNSAVSMFLPSESDIWIGCGKSIAVFETDNLYQKASIHLETEGECDASINCMVQAGQGLWVSYHSKSLLRLYHIVSRKLLQQYDISVDSNTFYTGSSKCYRKFQGSLNHEIMCLTSSPGLLWVGTSSGMILTYPLPLDQNSDPKLILRPSISMHGYSGSARFFSIVPFGFVALHAYTSLLPESSCPSPFKENDEISSGQIKAIQKQRNSEAIVGEDRAYNSLFGNSAAKRSAFKNNPSVRQDDPDINIREDQSQMGLSKLEKSSNVIMDSLIVPTSTKTQGQSSTLDGAAFVIKDIPEDTKANDISMRRADSGYGSAKSTVCRKLSPTSRQNSQNIITKAPSGRLSRKSAIRASRGQSFVLSTRPISRSGSWKIDSTNSYVVISGGDGYKDWKNRQTHSYRNDEALLLAWMIKIQGPS